jgi:hypothetical protein
VFQGRVAGAIENTGQAVDWLCVTASFLWTGVEAAKVEPRTAKSRFLGALSALRASASARNDSSEKLPAPGLTTDRDASARNDNFIGSARGCSESGGAGQVGVLGAVFVGQQDPQCVDAEGGAEWRVKQRQNSEDDSGGSRPGAAVVET